MLQSEDKDGETFAFYFLPTRASELWRRTDDYTGCGLSEMIAMLLTHEPVSRELAREFEHEGVRRHS